MYVKWFIEWISSDESIIYMESLKFLVCDFVCFYFIGHFNIIEKVKYCKRKENNLPQKNI